jgi:hypothetical protein
MRTPLARRFVMFLSRLFRRKRVPVIQGPLMVGLAQPTKIAEPEVEVVPINVKSIRRESVVFRQPVKK